jgi:GNAT superfamily N-acetyltransferase
MPLTPSIVVRHATDEDVGALVFLVEQLFQLEQDFSFCERKQRTGLRLLLRHPGACVRVAEVGGKVRGMCTCQLVVSTAEGAVSGWMEDLVVDRSWRGMGIGVQLLHAVLVWARDAGATRLQLLADRNNEDAIGFYKHLGWHDTNLVAMRKQVGRPAIHVRSDLVSA